MRSRRHPLVILYFFLVFLGCRTADGGATVREFVETGKLGKLHSPNRLLDNGTKKSDSR